MLKTIRKVTERYSAQNCCANFASTSFLPDYEGDNLIRPIQLTKARKDLDKAIDLLIFNK